MKMTSKNRIDNSPIIIIGAERSGTTLLYSILSNHKDLYWFSRIDDLLPSFPVLCSYFRRFFLKDKKTIAIKGRIGRSKGIFSPTECLNYWLKIFKWGNEKDYLIKDDVFSEKDLGISEREAILEDFILRMKILRKKRLLLKQPGFSLKIKYFNRLLPEAKFIHIVREPVANIISYVKAKDLSNQKFWGTKIPQWKEYLDCSNVEQSILQLSTISNIITNDINQISNKERRCLLVSYEDLISNTDAEVSRILDFLDLKNYTKLYNDEEIISYRKPDTLPFTVNQEYLNIIKELEISYNKLTIDK